MVAGGSMPSSVEHGGHHVDDVRVLRAHVAAVLDPRRPVHDERVGRAAAVGFALPPAERRVPGEGPAPRVVVEVLRATELVDDLQAVLDRFRAVVEELGLVGGAGDAALGARAVVGDHHDQRVVELADGAQELDEATDVVVGVAEEPGEDLHLTRVEAALVVRQRVPLGHVGVVAGELAVGRDDAELLLACERPGAVGVPPVVELPGVLVGPLLRNVVRRVGRARAEVQVERLVGVDLLGVGDELDRPCRRGRG